MPVSYPAIITPGQQRIYFGMEGQYGIAPTTSTAGTASGTSSLVFLEPCQAITTAIQRTPYEAHEYTGVPADLFDLIETTHHSTITITTPYRANGIAAWSLAAIMGSQQGNSLGAGMDTVTTATNGFTNSVHTIVPNNLSNNINTFTIWHDQGDAQFTSGTRGMLQMCAATPESVRLTFSPPTALMAEIVFQANFPQYTQGSGSTLAGYTPPVAGVIKLGSDATYKADRMMGFQGVSANFNIMSSAAVKYTNKILTGEMTITRQNEVIESPFSQNPTYYLPGPIAVTGSFDFLYDGLGDLGGSATLMQDYLAFQSLGTLAAQNEIKYLDNSGNGFDITFYPIKWNSFTLNASAQSLKVSAGFTSYNALSAAQGSPVAISAVKQILLGNNITFKMNA